MMRDSRGRMGDDALVKAVWRGPFAAEIAGVPDIVNPGDEVEIPEAQLESAHFERAANRSQDGPAKPAVAFGPGKDVS